MLNKSFTFPFLLTLFVFPAFSQVHTNKVELETLKKYQLAREKSERGLLLNTAGVKKWPGQKLTRNGIATLAGIDAFGYPLYVSTAATSGAAASIGTDQLWT